MSKLKEVLVKLLSTAKSEETGKESKSSSSKELLELIVNHELEVHHRL